ncbi:hypothetical protein D1007_53074 [Hordeum vulgare]|nr:hypothetical protein D1007_53074 [Hordeum vulgare]
MHEGVLHIRDVEGPKKTGSMEARLEAMEQQVFKCQGMVERGLNANHMMIMEFTNKHKIDANDIRKHLSRLYDRIDHLQAQIYDLQNQNWLGWKPHGTIDAESEFWITHTEKKPYLRKLWWGPPTNDELLEQLFRGYAVDRSTALVPGHDYGQNQGQDLGAEEEEEFQGTPTSASKQRSQRCKRSSNTSSTLTSPVKKSKSPMRTVGTYNGTLMTDEGYQAVIDSLHARRGLLYTRLHVKDQIVVLKSTYSFWRYMQVHTGLGWKQHGTIDAESEFWITHTEKKPYLRKLWWGPPANDELLEQLFRGYAVDRSTAFVPGHDYGQNHGQDLGAEEEEEFQEHLQVQANKGARDARGHQAL